MRAPRAESNAEIDHPYGGARSLRRPPAGQPLTCSSSAQPVLTFEREQPISKLMSAVILLGAALCAVGIIGYLATGRKSPTALIPAIFGAVFLVLGWFGQPGGLLVKVALGLALLGFLATFRGLLGLAKGERGAATLSKATMGALCAAFVLFELL